MDVKDANALLLAAAVLDEDARRSERRIKTMPGNAKGWAAAARERRAAAKRLRAMVPPGAAFHDVLNARSEARAEAVIKAAIEKSTVRE